MAARMDSRMPSSSLEDAVDDRSSEYSWPIAREASRATWGAGLSTNEWKRRFGIRILALLAAAFWGAIASRAFIKSPITFENEHGPTNGLSGTESSSLFGSDGDNEGDGGDGGDGDGLQVDVEEEHIGSDQQEDLSGESLCGIRKPARALPRCFSSPNATVASGEWVKCQGGVKDSPVQKVYNSPEFSFLTRCDLRWASLGHRGGLARPYWEWEPGDCNMEFVDANRFCSVTRGFKGILLVGDSLSRLMTVTLGSVLGAKLLEAHREGDKWSACDGKLQVRFIRNDYLDVRTHRNFATGRCKHPDGKPANNTICRVFAADGTLKDFDVLIVNSGAHPRDTGEYTMQMTKTSRFLMQQMERLHGKDQAFMVYRNTVPGHWECTDMVFDGPIARGEARQRVADAPQSYHWPNFRQENLRVEGVFLADGWHLLDAYTPTVLRSDSHIGGHDCLHYCVPGPADIWVVMLYNMLAARAEGIASGPNNAKASSGGPGIGDKGG